MTAVLKPVTRIAACIVVVVAVIAALSFVHVSDRPLFTALTLLIFVILISSVRWGLPYAVFLSLLAALGLSWSIPPVGHFHLADSRVSAVLIVYLVSAFAASHLSDRQKRAEEAARRSESELRDLIENIPAMAFINLPGPSNAFSSRGWREYTGLSAEATAASGWQSIVHPDDLESHLEKWRVCAATGQPYENEARYRRAADGEYRWFLVRAVPLRDAQGNILKWYGALTDIEDRKRAEQERERIRQLEADLAHTNRVSMMGELAASLAHEVKQPIAAAITNAKTCLRWATRDVPDLEEVRAAACRMVVDNERAAGIIDRVRSLYKKGTPQREPVDANELIREMIVLLQSEAARYSILIRSELTDSVSEVMADRVQLQQVLLNLMLNSIEAMKDSGGNLTVRSQSGQDGQLLISVSDTGVGLPVEKVDQIFNAFFTTKPQGSGMGLAISRSIVESHGGRLWATPNTGRGATFQFTIPTEVRASSTSAG